MSIKLVIADDDALIKERYIRDGIKMVKKDIY